MTHYYYYYHNYHYFGCLNVSCSSQQACLGPCVSPDMNACAARLESPVAYIEGRQTSTFLSMTASMGRDVRLYLVSLPPRNYVPFSAA